MRIDLFGLPVQPFTFRKPVKKEIPVTFRRTSKAEDRAEKMAMLYKHWKRPSFSEEELEEGAARLWKRIAREHGLEEAEENDEKEK